MCRNLYWGADAMQLVKLAAFVLVLWILTTLMVVDIFPEVWRSPTLENWIIWLTYVFATSYLVDGWPSNWYLRAAASAIAPVPILVDSAFRSDPISSSLLLGSGAYLASFLAVWVTSYSWRSLAGSSRSLTTADRVDRRRWIAGGGSPLTRRAAMSLVAMPLIMAASRPSWLPARVRSWCALQVYEPWQYLWQQHVAHDQNHHPR